jgi:hypothetical protein
MTNYKQDLFPQNRKMRKKSLGCNALGILSLIDVRFLLEAILSSQTRLHFIRYTYIRVYLAAPVVLVMKPILYSFIANKIMPIAWWTW